MDEVTRFVKMVLNENTIYSYYIITYTSGSTYQEFQRPCYGGIDDYCSELDCGIKTLTVFHPWPAFNREVVEFLLNGEMFGKYFLTKDTEKGRAGGFDINLEHPYEEVLGAMIALRAAWNRYNCELFQQFRDVGASILEAMMLVETIYEEGDRLYANAYSYDHNLFPFDLTLSDLADGGYRCEYREPSYDRGYLFGSVWGCWVDSTGDNRNVTFNKIAVKPYDKWGLPYIENTEKSINLIYKTFKEA